ncbi:Amine oxidase [Abortiporus biennis]
MDSRGYELLKQIDEHPPADDYTQRSRWRSRHVVFGTLFLFGAAAFSIFYGLPPSRDLELYTEHLSSSQINDTPLKQCASNLPPPANPPAKVNIWASLSTSELVSITKWVEDPARRFNLTRGDIASIGDNFIYHIEAYRPSKGDALAYLSSPLEENLPKRYARVTIHHGAVAAPVVMDYLVGPLPINGDTGIRNLTEIYHRDSIPFNARGYAGDVGSDLSPLLNKIMTPILNLTHELFGINASDSLVAGVHGPFSFDGTYRRAWISWRRNVAGPWLHPLGLFLFVDHSGPDPSKWKMEKLVYNQQVFKTTEELLDAYNNGTLRLLPSRLDRNDTEWSTRKRPDPKFKLDLDHLPGPRSVSFAGLRFRVDRATQYISWMGWGLYLGFDRDMGLSLWDLRFRGERLIYELSPQEAIGQYAGNDPMQSSTAWLDRYFGMGASVRDMLPGYDCPYEATYLPATTHISSLGVSQPLEIMIIVSLFSQCNSKQSSLNVNFYWVTAVFDYIFQIDGTIEVRLSASGYLQGGFWEENQQGYGTAIRGTTMGSLHDHVINYKVDLDVVGTENSLLHTHTSQQEVTKPWLEDDEWGSTVIEQKIFRDYVDNENDALLKFPNNFQGGYSIVNKEEKNSWGIPRGYAIHPGYSPIHNTVVGSRRLLNNANWARYNLAVSVRKDTEPSSSSMWNQNLPGAPMVDFHKFFDGENITQQDLVAWVNVGMHHLPQAEDSPNTRTNLAASSFFLTPLNYFDYDVSIESTNAILLTAPDKTGQAFAFDDYGVRPANCIPDVIPPFEYLGLKAFDVDGKPAPPSSVEELRKSSELFHRIDVEL